MSRLKEKNLKAYTKAYVSKNLDKDLSESTLAAANREAYWQGRCILLGVAGHLVAALADCAVHPEKQTLQELTRQKAQSSALKMRKCHWRLSS